MINSLWQVKPSGVSYGYFDKYRQFRKRDDYFDMFAFFIVEEGRIGYSFANGKSLTADKGDLIICPPHMLLSKKVIDEVSLHLIRIFTDKDCDMLPAGKISFGDDPRFNSTLTLLKNLINQNELPVSDYRRHLLEDIWYQVCAEKESPFADFVYTSLDGLLVKTLDWVNDHLSDMFTVEELADRFGCSKVTLIDKFKRGIGKTPSEYIRDLRIDKARILLSNTANPLKAIALECGFCNEYYLCKVFKRHVGLTPSQFRNMY